MSSSNQAFGQNFAPITQTSADGKYTYTTYQGDPSKARFYTLKNGLTVILSENHNEPRVYCYMPVKAGSNQDPATNTGLAHYLEHMLFKGTDQFATTNFPAEKVQLDKIEALYERYNHTTDAALRKRIYEQIDSLSGVAAQYAVANEYDKVMQALGSRITNAFTSFENTTYMEDFPSNQMERFLDVQANGRFKNPIMRIFHTELEAVYEEKNISLDSGGDKAWEAMMSHLFKKMPYGTQTTIGTIEHLKNPSLVEINKYFNTYYVPNNMAMIMVGDLDPDKTIALVDKYFSWMQPKALPNFTMPKEDDTTAPEEVSVFSPEDEEVNIGFRVPSASAAENTVANLFDLVLSNGKTGLIDLNLVQAQKVLSASSSYSANRDAGDYQLSAKPLQGQTLEQVRDLLLEQVRKVKAGEFDESLLSAIIANKKVLQIRQMERPTSVLGILHNGFVTNVSWGDYLKSFEDMKRLTKADVVAFANKYFKNNYVVVFKRNGEDKNVVKVEKPHITPVQLNRDAQSEFGKRILAQQVPPLQPKFVDFRRDLQVLNLKPNLPVWYVKNPLNALFNLNFVWDMGKNNNKLLPLAFDYLQLLGTDRYTPEQFQKELYKLALNLSFGAGDDESVLSMVGLEENFDQGLALLEHLMRNVKADDAILSKLIEAQIKGRADTKLNSDAIGEGLYDWATFGSKNPFNSVMSNDELKRVKAQDLVNLLKSLVGVQHTIRYYGVRSPQALLQGLRSAHPTATLRPVPPAVRYPSLQQTENHVFFADYDMVQASITWQRNMGAWDKMKAPAVGIFNAYFGPLPFREIRESKGLAYSTYASYVLPYRKDKPFMFTAFVGTQADKIHDSIAAMKELLANMPKSDQGFANSMTQLKKVLETKRVNGTAIWGAYDQAKRLGLTESLDKATYAAINSATLAGMERFHDQQIKGKPYNLVIVASKKRINLEELKRYGKVTEVSLDQLFGY
jgi:predicted Zn-dependent peptidase